jgi:hypothetical protein
LFFAAPFTGALPEALFFRLGGTALLWAAVVVASLAGSGWGLAESSAQAATETSKAPPRANRHGLTIRDIFFQRLGIFFSTPGGLRQVGGLLSVKHRRRVLVSQETGVSSSEIEPHGSLSELFIEWNLQFVQQI